MAREYPRFLFSNPQDTKSKGPFIVHTLFPQLIAKVSFADDGFHYVDPLSIFVPAEREKIDQTISAMHIWFERTRMKEAGLSEDFYDRFNDIAERIRLLNFFDDFFSTAMKFKPIMGATLEVGKASWRIIIEFGNDDTYNSMITKLKQEFEKKYNTKANWPI